MDYINSSSYSFPKSLCKLSTKIRKKNQHINTQQKDILTAHMIFANLAGISLWNGRKACVECGFVYMH